MSLLFPLTWAQGGIHSDLVLVGGAKSNLSPPPPPLPEGKKLKRPKISPHLVVSFRLATAAVFCCPNVRKVCAHWHQTGRNRRKVQLMVWYLESIKFQHNNLYLKILFILGNPKRTQTEEAVATAAPSQGNWWNTWGREPVRHLIKFFCPQNRSEK